MYLTPAWTGAVWSKSFGPTSWSLHAMVGSSLDSKCSSIWDNSCWASLLCFYIMSHPIALKCIWGNNPYILNSFYVPFHLRRIGEIHFLFKSPTWIKAHCENFPIYFRFSSLILYIWLSLQIIFLYFEFRVILLAYIPIISKYLLIWDSLFALFQDTLLSTNI